MKKIVFPFIFILLIFGCGQKTIDLGKNISFDIQENVSYGKEPQQKLDLYLPTNKDSIKGIFILIHGGGWRSGDKLQLTFFTYSLMEKFQDYAFANINYRLADNHSFILPNQTDDIDSALDFLTGTSKELKSTPQFILLGNSAGAHLSMLYSYNRIFDSKHRTKIKAVVNIVGPADLNHVDFKRYSDYSFVEKHMTDLSKPTPTDITNKDIPNPVFWIDEKSPSTISFYGINDQVVPLSQKAILDSALTKNNVINQSYEFSGGHLDWDKEKNRKILVDKIDEFLIRIK